MTTGALIWLAAFGLSAVVFFAIAGLVTVRGARELRELLSRRMADGGRRRLRDRDARIP